MSSLNGPFNPLGVVRCNLNKTNKLIISFLGFKTDTLIISSDKKFVHFLTEDLTTNLDEVSLTERKKSSKLSFTANQNLILKAYGGIVPELASAVYRRHSARIRFSNKEET